MRAPWLMALVLVVGALVHAPAIGVPILNEDEALYATTAAGMTAGRPPYIAGVESKPPGIFYLYQWGFALVGRYHMQALHALTIVWVLATALLLARLVGGRAGPWAALFYTVFTTVQEPSVLATQCELLYNLPLALAALVLWRWRRCPLAALVAGILIGLATLIKPTAVSLLVAGGLWLLLRRRPAIGRALALGAGIAIPWLGAWAMFSHLGVWDDLVYYAFRWTTQMYLPTGFAEFSLVARFFGKVGPWLVLLVVPWTLAGRAVLRAWRGDDEPELTGLLALWTAGAMGMVCLGGRFYDHYFPAPVLPLSALAAVGVATLERRGLLRLVAAGTALPVTACFVLALTFDKSMVLLGERPRGPYLEVARYIEEHTRPDDPIFVWGYFPLIYVAADRLAASRFVGCHYLTGYAALGLGRQVSPAIEERLQVPGGFDQLIFDLEERKPALFIDTAPADLHFWSRYPLSRYPRLAAYVAEHYVRETEVDGTILYRRSSE